MNKEMAQFIQNKWMDGQKNEWMGDWEKMGLFTFKNGLPLFCNLHKIGANIYSSLAFARFPCKKVWSWMDGWMGGRAGLMMIAYSNQKAHFFFLE